jgi:polyhydroxyalkanoate synthesis repressor PhaR
LLRTAAFSFQFSKISAVLEKEPPMAARKSDGDGPITIKKYANRRLYNTASSSYVTLDDLATMVKDEQEFVVYDAKSGDDITRSVLTQIIVEEESKGQHLLPIGFLRQLIAYYGDSLESLVPKYLEQSMDAFRLNQDDMRQHLTRAFDGVFPFGSLEDMSRQNMDMMRQAMEVFTPFAGQTAAANVSASESRGTDAGEDDAFGDLQEQIEALKRQVDALSRAKRAG